MTNTVQDRGWISTRGWRGASAALTLAAVLVLGVGATQLAQAQTFTVLYSFCSQSNCTDGANPYAGLVQDAAGNLYGTTAGGGIGGLFGTVFKIDTNGTETVLYSFCSVSDCSDGDVPLATLVLDAQGSLYGTTGGGGASGTGCGGGGCGTVFKLDTSGNETVLYSFTGGTTDGCAPLGGVVLDAAGNLYGTTYGCGSSSEGTVFKVDTSGTETVLHNFTGGAKDGGYPEYSSLLLDKKGNLYGVTWYGGPSGNGLLYKISSSGAFTMLRGLEGPYGTPAMDKQGNLYGTTEWGGHGDGSVWKMSPKRKLTTLHSFRQADGIEPRAGVVLDAEGNLYGTTWRGGPHSIDGTVYKLNRKGVLTVLHSFAYASDGAEPYDNLIMDAAGSLYGTAWVGGNYNDKCKAYRNEQGCGTVWKLTP